MKKLTIAFILGAIVFTLIAWNNNMVGGAGKYVLFNGEYLYMGRTAPMKTIGLFKMDTTTGDCWVLEEGGRSGTRGAYSSWRHIGNKR